MKVTFDQNHRQSLRFVLRTIAKRTTLPVLWHSEVHLNGSVKVTGTDLDNWLSTTLDAAKFGEGRFLIPRDTLDELSKCKGETNIKAEVGHVLSIDSMGMQASANSLDPEQFPPEPVIPANHHTFEANSGELLKALKRVMPAMSTDESRFILNGIKVEVRTDVINLVATNGRVLHWDTIPRRDCTVEQAEAIKTCRDMVFSLENKIAVEPVLLRKEVMTKLAEEARAEDTMESMIIPTKTVQHLAAMPMSDDVVKFGHWVRSVDEPKGFASIECAQERIVAKLVDGDYPNYRQVIPNENDIKVKLDCAAMISAVKRVAKVCTEKSNSVKLYFQNNKVTISANSPEKGNASVVVPLTWKADDLAIAFDPHYIAQAMEACGEECWLALKDDTAPGLFTNGAFNAVVMPMRMSA